MMQLYFPLIYLGMITLVITIYQYLYNRHRKLLRNAIDEVEDYRDKAAWLTELHERFNDNAIDGEAFLLNDSDRGSFIIVRDGFMIKEVKYDRNDYDDREYKLIHAQEIADKLNEKP